MNKKLLSSNSYDNKHLSNEEIIKHSSFRFSQAFLVLLSFILFLSVPYLFYLYVSTPVFSSQNNIKINNLQLIKGAIFDLDGTLLDTEPIYEKAAQDLINQYGNGHKYDWDVKEKVIGGKEEVGAKAIVEAYKLSISPKEFIEKRAKIAETMFADCSPCEGAEKVTNLLKEKYGMKLAVASSSTKDLYALKTKNHLKWFNKDIDKSVLGDDKRLKNGKPAPDIFLLAAKEIGVDIKNCIVFEDAINGVKAALASEAPVVVAVPMAPFRKIIENLPYDKSKTQLIILNSLKEFDMSLIK